MDDVQEINVDEMMAQIRESMVNPQGALTDRATSRSSDSPVTADLTSLQSTQDIYHIHLTSHRKFLGSFVLFAKKVVRQLLTPSLERQTRYNEANIRLAMRLWEQVEAHQKVSSSLAEQLREECQELYRQLKNV